MNGSMSVGTKEVEDNEVTASYVKKLEPRLLGLAERLAARGLDEASLLRAGTSGFRGRNNEELVRNIVAYSVALGELLGQRKTVIVGYDRRPGSTHNALLCAVILKYSNVATMITESPTTISCLAKTVSESNIKRATEEFFGVMCGASHNPLTDNGMNFIMPDGSIAEEDYTDQLAERALKIDFKPSSRTREGQAEIRIINPTQNYVNSIVEFAGVVSQRDLVVVVDPLNGAGKNVLPDLVGSLGVTCHMIQRNGFEGMIDLDPRNNLEHIKKEMKKRNADLGVLIDGDGDRVMFVYPRIVKDRIIVEEADFNEAFAAILEFLIGKLPVHAVSTNVASSTMFRDICRTYGLNIYDRNPVGFKYQSRDMRLNPDQVVVGIEGNSGGFTVSSFSHEKDGCLAAALAIRMVAETGSLADIIDHLRKKYGRRYTQETNVHTSNLPTRENRRAVIESLKKEFKVGHVFCQKKIVDVITVDGIKLNFADGSSLLIRASGTEPKFRVVPEVKVEREIKMLSEAAKRILELASLTYNVN